MVATTTATRIVKDGSSGREAWRASLPARKQRVEDIAFLVVCKWTCRHVGSRTNSYVHTHKGSGEVPTESGALRKRVLGTRKAPPHKLTDPCHGGYSPRRSVDLDPSSRQLRSCGACVRGRLNFTATVRSRGVRSRSILPWRFPTALRRLPPWRLLILLLRLRPRLPRRL